MALERYRPSGRFRPALAVYAPAAIAGTAALACGYQWVQSRIPLVFLNVLITVGFGAALGLVAVIVIARAEVRSPLISYGLAVVIALFALLSSHVWILMSAASEVVHDFPDLTVPGVMQSGWRNWLDGRLNTGWIIRDVPIKGRGVLAVWAGEALLAGGLAVAVMRRKAAQPYCERCMRWFESQSARVEGRDATAVAPLLSCGDVLGAVSLIRGDRSGDAPQLVFSRWFCPDCGEHEYLSIAEVTFTRNRRGELEPHERSIASLLLMPPQARAKFSERFGPNHPAPPLT